MTDQAGFKAGLVIENLTARRAMSATSAILPLGDLVWDSPHRAKPALCQMASFSRGK
jgi:hypothetical protein